MKRTWTLRSGVELHRPNFAFAGLYGLAAAALVALAAWPGFMSYDSLLAYQQGLEGVRTMLWPPLHTYLFWISQKLGAGAGGLFAVQTFLIFFSAALVIFTLVRSRAAAWLLSAAFLLSFVYVPPQLGVLMSLWRDVPTASFALLALALWLQAARVKSRLLLLAAILAAGLSVALRYNAVALLCAVFALMVWRPWLAPGARTRDRVLVAVALVAVLGAGWASTRWRLPDLRVLRSVSNLGGAQQLDLFGVSACAGRNYVPKEVSSGVELTPAQVRRAYTPTHLHLTLRPKPGLPPLKETDADGKVPAVWRDLLVHETSCYVQHRSLVMAEQMGMMADDGPFIPVHSGIDKNRFGLVLASPERSSQVRNYVERNAPEPWRRPYLLYAGALLAFALAFVLRRDLRLLMAAMLAGVFGYLGPLFLAAPAADARYIFPSNTLAVLMMVLAAGVLADRVLDPRK